MRYIVFRRGYNSANNPAMNGGPETVPVADVEAESPEQACELAGKVVTTYHNQTLFARPAADVEAERAELAEKVKAI